MLSLSQTHPASVLRICAHLERKEYVNLGLSSKGLLSLLEPIFQSLAELKHCRKIKSNGLVQALAQCKTDEQREYFKDHFYCTSLDVANFFLAQLRVDYNEMQLRTVYNPRFLNRDEASNFFNGEDEHANFILKKFKVGNSEAALRHIIASKEISIVDFTGVCKTVKNINSPSSNGNTALHWAALRGHIHVVDTLLHHYHADPNVQNRIGETPLHIAARLNSPMIFKILLDNKASCLIKNRDGKTATEIPSNHLFRSLFTDFG